MYTLQPTKLASPPKHNNLGCLLICLLITVAAVASPFLLSPIFPRNQVVVAAYEWNNGKVQLWNAVNGVSGSPTAYREIADGTVCTRLDDAWYKYGDGDTAIYYYKLNCDGKIGYVERDQIR